MAGQRQPRPESLPVLAACLATIWIYIPLTLIALLTGRIEWMALVGIAAVVGACYGRACERRMIRRIVDQWIASVQDDPHRIP